MVKKNRFLLSLIVLILCVSIALLAFACNKDNSSDDSGDDTQEETLLFPNGDFTQFAKNSDGTVTYPAAPTSWTATPGSTSSSSTSKTPQSSDDISVGVINVNEYTPSPAKPTEEGVTFDDYVLMINNKTFTSYSYVSSSVTIAKSEEDKSQYYKLSFYVKTSGLEKPDTQTQYGAYVYIKGGAYVEFENIIANDWTKYEIYFKGSNTGDKTITVSLGLGEGDLQNGRMVKGYAFFDHVVLEDLTNVPTGALAFTDQQYKDVQYSNTVTKYDLSALDGNFNYGTVSSAGIYTPTQVTGTAGKGSGDSASTGSSYLEKGTIDIANQKIAQSRVFSGYSQDPIDLTNANATYENNLHKEYASKQLFIHNKEKTAYIYKDNVGMLIKTDKYYKVTVYVNTYLASGYAYLGLNSVDEELLSLDDISTNGTWTQYTFYIEGNQYSDNTLYVSMSLGKGGSGDGKWAKGVAFFDNLFIDESTATEYATAPAANKYSYKTVENDADLVNLNAFKSTQYEESFKDITALPTVEDGVSPFVDSHDAKLSVLTLTNAKYSASSIATIYKNAADDTVDETNKGLFTIKPNKAYLISYWIKLSDLNDGATASVVLNKYDTTKQNSYKDAKSSLSSISTLSVDTLKDYASKAKDGYALVSMYVLGDIKDTNYLSLDFTLGTGSAASQSASLVKGTISLTNLRFQEIAYDKYSSVSTGTTTTKYSFVGSGASGEISSNGTFNFIDMTETISLHAKDEAAEPAVWTVDGVLQQNAVPTNWTITDSTALKQNGGHSVAGIVNVANYAHKGDYTGLSFGGFDIDSTKNPNVLLIDSKDVKSLGYKSNSISLSAKSYYVFSVYAKSLNGNKIGIKVAQTDNDAVADTALIVENPLQDWTQYLIYVKTGITSTSVNVTLYAGDPDPDSTATIVDSQVIYTMATYAQIDADIYDAADDTASTVKKVAWVKDTMYLTSSSQSDTELATPSNWTGAAIDTNASTSTDDLAKGIFDDKNSNWDIIDIDADSEFAELMIPSVSKSVHGDSVLVIDNKKAGSYGFTSPSFTLEKAKYYKVSIDILTKDISFLKEADIDKDDSKYDSFSEKNIYDTATITLNVNNKTYTFGKHVEKDKTEGDFSGDTAQADWNEYRLSKARLVANTDAWKTLTYYIALADDIEETVSATLKISIGGKSVSYWAKGYVFADNFVVEELTKAEYTAQAPEDAKVDPATFDEDIASKTYKIAYSNEDAKADEETEDEDEEETTTDPEAKNWLWLYITSGVIGGILVVILVIYLIKRYAPKKKFKKAKKTLTKENSTRGKFSE